MDLYKVNIKENLGELLEKVDDGNQLEYWKEVCTIDHGGHLWQVQIRITRETDDFIE